MRAAEQIKANRQAATQSPLAIGYVVDVDDPQQTGRVRACCPFLGDDPDPTTMTVTNIPWARMGTPLAGVMPQGYRGVDGKVTAEVSYGFMGIPKVGTEVLVAVAEDDPSLRVIVACLHHQSGTTAMPHGRYQSTGSFPDGPLALDGSQIQPLYDNYTTMFSGPYATARSSFEWMSRGADYTYSAGRGVAKNPRQTTDDNEDVTLSYPDGRTIQYTQGYATDRVGDQPNVANDPDRKYDPQTYGLTSPGFHSLSMDDRVENCRIRLRTTTGHQVILDDTNERIYISTFKGKNWVEMDAAGTIDIHSDTRINIHASKDINMTSEETIRLTSANIHLRASNEIRTFSYGDTHVVSNANIRAQSISAVMVETGTTFSVLATGDAKITSSANVHVLAATTSYVTGNSSVEILSSGNVLGTGAQVLMNSGTAASSADSASSAAPKTAYHANRIPMHEPWPRVMVNLTKATDDANMTATPVVYTSGSMSDFEYTDYNNSNIGRLEYGISLNRNAKWHR